MNYDYYDVAGSVTFLPGETLKWIGVELNDDFESEQFGGFEGPGAFDDSRYTRFRVGQVQAEYFEIHLSNATIEDAMGVVNLLDNEANLLTDSPTWEIFSSRGTAGEVTVDQADRNRAEKPDGRIDWCNDKCR